MKPDMNTVLQLLYTDNVNYIWTVVPFIYVVYASYGA